MKSVAESITGSRLKAKILNWLFVDATAETRVTERQLAKQLGIPAGSIHKVLLSLVEDQLIAREEGPRGPQYRAPLEDPRLKALIAFFRQESEIVTKLKRALKPFKTIDYACIFGSFARGTTHRESDVDVLVLENSDEERSQILLALSVVSDKIGREANAQFYSVEEFRNNAQSGERVASSILRSPCIPLKGELSL